MAFIRVQNLKRDGDGRVRSGSASVIDVAYDPDAKSGHSRQKVRESLGRVLWLSEDRRSGVFLSKTRGLVAYDAGADAFSAVAPDDGRIAGCAPAIPTAEDARGLRGRIPSPAPPRKVRPAGVHQARFSGRCGLCEGPGAHLPLGMPRRAESMRRARTGWEARP
jgi:hypothetical protein